MTEFPARYYDGRSAEPHAVKLRFGEPGCLLVQKLSEQTRFRFDQIKVRPQLPGQPAMIDLPDDARLEVSDADAFFQMLRAHGGRRQWQHALESRWTAIAVVILLTLGFSWVIYDKGIPAAAKWVAYAMPEDVEKIISQQSLEALDRVLFQPSSLRPERRQRIRASMEEVIAVVGAGHTYSLQFRGGDKVGANAYAFPSGTIVFTDELVRMAANTDELRTIMAHEIGHVRGHHSLRILLQKSLLAGLAVAVTGDVAAVGSIAAALPKVLIEASFTREFEYEADAVAKEYLQLTGKPLTLFSDIMLRVAAEAPESPAAPGLLRTHPAAEERIGAFLD